MTRFRHPRTQAGASLIEVLVSFLIVSFGLLAMMATQANAIKFNKTNEYRSIATLLANDLGDRMKANLGGTTSYAMSGAYSPMTEIAAVSACAATVCTPTEIATRDIAEWRRALFFSLPGSDAYTLHDATNAAVDVWIAWRDPAESGTPPTGTDTVTECPGAFVSASSGTDPDDAGPPRCMYFRIALPSR